MHAKPKPEIILSESFGVRVTPEEKEQLQAAATSAGLTLSEYARQTLLRSQSDISRGERILLQELLAFRRVLLGLKLHESQGAAITDSLFKQLIDEADAVKPAMAERRIAAIPQKE